MEEVDRLASLKDSAINEAKKVLAFEVTRQVHGEAEAKAAGEAAEALFGGGGREDGMPSTEITEKTFEENAKVIDLLMICGLTSSRGEGRRLIAGGGVSIDGEKVKDPFKELKIEDFTNGEITIKKGKKVFHKVKLLP
jgi:tyrosyl-tRNA synthetase